MMPPNAGTKHAARDEHAMTSHWLPCVPWVRAYTRVTLGQDLLAALIVTIMLVPQSLAYALLAGLPAEMGLYASILPLIVYALMGTSRTLSVGPVAVASLMTASTVGGVAQQGTSDYASAAVMLALLSGLLLIGLGLLRVGFISNFLSHPVVSGFITASGVIIGLSQLRHILGVEAHGNSAPELLSTLSADLLATNPITLAVGVSALGFLCLCRSQLTPRLMRVGLSHRAADLVTRTTPIVAIVVTISAAVLWDLESHGVALVGHVPSGLPAFSSPIIDSALIQQLLLPAGLISLIGFVESVSVAKTLGAKRRQRIDANQELIGLGAANVASAISGGFPVSGGFSRSAVNFEAGAATQGASILTAIGIACAAIFLTPALYFLPKATLAATIIIAVASLVDVNIIKKSWHYSRTDFIAVAVTISLTLLLGVEIGVLSGIAVSIGLHLYKTTRPHVAIVGNLPGTEHYRNIDRHDVKTHDNILALRIDQSLYFANANYLEDIIYGALAAHEEVEHVVLMCSSVNEIDLSALEALTEINLRLSELGIDLHLSEVKGHVMDGLERSHFLEHLGGKIFLHHHAAITELAR